MDSTNETAPQKARVSAHTVLVDTYVNAAQRDGSAQPNYKGLAIHALPGLHDFIAAQVQLHCAPGGRALDLAAGSGAMSQRLCDLGYDVTATDYVSGNFRLHGSIPFFQADLNDNFSASRKEQFDFILAAEIIEHLENPRHFARQCFKALKPGGKLIVSTPNVDTVASILRFLREGCFEWFNEEHYRVDGHISPLTQWQLGKCFTEAGFATEWTGSFGDRAHGLRGSPRLMVLHWLLERLATKDKVLRDQIFAAVLVKPLTPA